MNKFKIIKHSIKSLLTLEPRVFQDHRGEFIETYHKSNFRDLGIFDEFVQDNHAKSTFGVLRGLHLQSSDASQSKLLRCVYGEVFDVAVDLRLDSPTKGQWVGEVLSSKNNKLFYIPAGFAHAFLTLSDISIVNYKLSDFYNPQKESAIYPFDKDLNISWSDYINCDEIILSDKDKNAQSYKQFLEGINEN
ncbi:MAG: dTDP-4-dehydrorhamnose 3,5-epimerase [Candidatus Cloacimonadota bacterium]|nr:MAG: dTDP-4-dehydrorhamnose 3,5-epimerase [Candidatus Cloacimonadota bacterium]